MRPITLLVGCSGTGKNYIASVFNLTSLPSFTTRPQREKETPGVEHEFVTMTSWNSVYSKQKNVVAKTFFAGNWYWGMKEQVENENYDVYIIDPAGVRYFLENFGDKINRQYTIVYIKASLYKRIKNMRERKDPWSKVLERLVNDFKEFRGFEKDKSIKKMIIEV
jgi:guanylate kinase